MRFLVSTDISSFREIDDGPGRMSFCGDVSGLSTYLTGANAIDVWICDGKEATEQLISQWLGETTHIPIKSILVKDALASHRLKSLTQGKAISVEVWPTLDEGIIIPRAEMVLRAAEMAYARSLSFQPATTVSRKPHGESTVILVGAGIVNLLTADLLVSRGLQVHILDKSPDPRSCTDWTRLGITNGGGNARMFTYMEADNYNEKGSEIYSNMRTIFRKTARSGGWSLKAPNDLTAAERSWILNFENLPSWLARSFRNDIYKINREAGDMWNEYMESAPQLFEGVTLRKDILRMYVEGPALEAAMALNSQHGTIIDGTTPEEFLAAYPQFRAAAASDHLAGGFTVKGFTVNIHPFVAKLIDRIEALGGRFTWECDVTGMRRDTSGAVTSLDSQLGNWKADHFVISPGTNGNTLLNGTASQDRMQGVLGVWLQIPNLNSRLQHSIKIHRRGHLVEDINVSVAKDTATGEDILMLGGGYGYTGLGRPHAGCPELQSLFDELEEVARIYFPEAHSVAKARGTLWPHEQYKYCVRPFTVTGLGIFEAIPTANGGQLIITGGNNTGGFAQAPAIARAVWRAIAGEHDPMHLLFHPSRGILSNNPARVSPPTLPPAPSPTVTEKRLDTAERPKLLLLCSDGPQHNYLRYRLDQSFPGYRCIVEPHDGQARHLQKKGRNLDAFYMNYHKLRRSILGHDWQRKDYFNQLLPGGYRYSPPDLIVDTLNCSQVWEAVDQWKPDFTIVSGTKYIGRKLNDRVGFGVNLHMGYLPTYKGNHCIFFALYDGDVDRVAATLHCLTSNLDGGDILDIVRPPISHLDNEETLYTRCLHMSIDRAVDLAKAHFRGEELDRVPQKADGRLFRHSDRTLMKELGLWWSLSVRGLLTSGVTTKGS